MHELGYESKQSGKYKNQRMIINKLLLWNKKETVMAESYFCDFGHISEIGKLTSGGGLCVGENAWCWNAGNGSK